MATITYKQTQKTQSLKCGDWVTINGSLCVIAQVGDGRFQLIVIKENSANRYFDDIVNAIDGRNGFTDSEIRILTNGDTCKKVNVEIVVS